MRELRYALRVLFRSPAYTLVAVLTLGLAIGGSTAVFSVVNGVLLRPMPYREPDRLMWIWESMAAFPNASVAYLDFLDWDKETQQFEDIAASRGESFTLTSTTPAQRVDGRMASHNLLPVLGVEPQLGRTFTPEEDQLGGAKVAIISHDFWQKRLGGDADVLSRTIALDGEPYAVVGVLKKDFVYRKAKEEVWIPLGHLAANRRSRGNHPGIYAVGRLKPGVTFEQGLADLKGISQRIGEANPQTSSHVTASMRPFTEEHVKDVRPVLLVLLGSVAFVLLIAITNVANLMLARGVVRRKEMAIRASLGANRGRLVRQLLVESIVLAVLGGALGALVALWAVDLLASAKPVAIPDFARITVDGAVLAFALGAALLSGIAAGVVPAISASRVNLQEAIKEGDARSGEGSGQLRLRKALVIAEVALALILLVGAGLSIRAFVRLSNTDLGFDPSNVLTGVVTVSGPQYADVAKHRQFIAELEAQVRQLPGVKAAAITGGMPIVGTPENSFTIHGRPRPDNKDLPVAVFYVVGPGYLETMGIQLVRGRGFTAQDTRDSPGVVMIDERLAEQFFPGQDPVGQALATTDGSVRMEIVGVVRHVLNYGLDQEEQTPYQWYVPHTQIPDDFYGMALNSTVVAVKTVGDPLAMVPQIQQVLAGLDATAPFYEIKTMDQYVTESLGARRFSAALLAAFAVFALGLAAVGLYAVMSYTVTQRTHEIGVRMALGAQPGAVQGLMVRLGVRLAVIGLVVGTLGALVLARVMAGVLQGIEAMDPATFLGVALVLGGSTVLASYLPARKASHVDPMIALRQE